MEKGESLNMKGYRGYSNVRSTTPYELALSLFL
jgi:hypothetical protein